MYWSKRKIKTRIKEHKVNIKKLNEKSHDSRGGPRQPIARFSQKGVKLNHHYIHCTYDIVHDMLS